MEERRSKVRLPAGFHVMHILGDDEQHDCLAEDLSAEGMCLTGDLDGWRRSRFAWLQFRLPGEDGPVIRALGELCHEEGGTHRGFRFKYIYPRDRRRFEAFVEAQVARAG
jgi:hypothetical protein